MKPVVHTTTTYVAVDGTEFAPPSMTIGEASDALKRIDAIDKMFEGASGWGSWMVMCANEREGLVDRLRGYGVEVEHKYQARTADGQRTD